MRTLLGIAEAGFYPGVIFYLTVWLPRRVRSSATGWFVFGIPLASILGGPLSSAILEHGRIGRFANWQILLLTEALPALLLGLLLPWLLADSPQTASWLSAEDRSLLAEAQAADEPVQTSSDRGSAFGLSAMMHVARFAAIYFGIQFGLYTLGFWLPKILHNLGVAQHTIGWQISLVWAMAAVGMVVWGRIADTSPRARWTLAVPLLAAALGYGVTAALRPGSANELWPLLLAFGVAAAGGLAATPTFWSQMTLGQAPARVAVMIAIVNALGNLGGFAGPALLGRLEQHSGTYTGGMLAATAVLLTGATLLYARRAEA
jgi:ACS family tartrate transporter-like MFS transporter